MGGMTADVMPCINNVVEEVCLSTQEKREVSFDSISIYQAISDIYSIVWKEFSLEEMSEKRIIAVTGATGTKTMEVD